MCGGEGTARAHARPCAHQGQERPHEPLRLAHGQAEDEPEDQRGYCQVGEKRVDRPPRYWARSRREPAMLGIRNGRQPQLDNTARALTEASVDDATTGITLIEAVDGALGRVTADAAYDTIGFYEAAGARGATVVVPPTSTANVSRHGPRSSARDRTILAVKETGRRRWKQMSGYHGQARVENAFFRYTSIIGDGLRACSPAGRGTEVVLACNILNQMTGLGRPMSYRIGR